MDDLRHGDQPHPKPVGIKDIAKALGISTGTVDRALHAKPGINPTTRARVLRMAESLGSLEAILDGEIVALDASGRPDFGLLQQRMHVTTPSQVRTLVERVPVSYLAFDLLFLEGHQLLDRGYTERRSLLEGLPSCARSTRSAPTPAARSSATVRARRSLILGMRLPPPRSR